MVTSRRDRNGLRLWVLLHTSNNLKVRAIYLFMKTGYMQLLLVPGILLVGGQADQVRTVMGKQRGGTVSPLGWQFHRAGI